MEGNNENLTGFPNLEYTKEIEQFYRIIRSNNVNNLKELLYLEKYDIPSLYHILSTAYEELKLRNVPLSEDIEFEVEWKLTELQFSSNDPNSMKQKPKEMFEYVTNHLKFTFELISKFLSKYLNRDNNTDLEFLFCARSIAQHIAVLKRSLEFTYEKIPWEEMEFCLVIFVINLIKPENSDFIYQLVLDRKRILNNLKEFLKDILDLQKIFEKSMENNLLNSDQEKFEQVKKELNEQLKDNLQNPEKDRNISKQNILSKNPELKYLYEDFSLLRNVYSLIRITMYIHRATSVTFENNGTLGRLVIQRALQVVGEYLKDTPDAPNISKDLYRILIKSAPLNLQPFFHKLRNTLSHSTALEKRLELEANKDDNFFINIQNDLKIVNSEIVYVLYKYKIEAFKVYFKKLLKNTNITDVKSMIRNVNYNKLEESKYYEMPDFSKARKMIELFWEMVKGDLNDDEGPYRNTITKILKSYDSRLEDIYTKYIGAVDAFFFISGMDNIENVHNIARTNLIILNTEDPKTLFEEIFPKLHFIYKTFKKARGFEEEDISATDSKLIEVTKIISLIQSTLKWDLPKVGWIEEMRDQITVIEDDFIEKTKKVAGIFAMIEDKLNDKQDKAKLQDAVNNKYIYHLTKKRLLNAMFEDSETFEDILKKLNLAKKKVTILEHYKKMHEGKTNELKRHILEISDDYGSLVNKLGDMFSDKYLKPIKRFYNNLKLKKPLQDKVNKAVIDALKDEIKLYYSKRLLMLKELFRNISDIKCIQNDNHLITAVETVVLDLTEYLHKLGLLGDNKLFLIERSPILIGKQLRNHLAHFNILTAILPYNAMIPLLVYAQGLLKLGDSIFEQTGIRIGNKLEIENLSISSYFLKCLDIVQKQDNLFYNIKKNEIIVTEADENGKYINGWTVLDFALDTQNTELVRNIIATVNSESKNICEFVSPEMLVKNFKMFSFLVENTNLDINYKYKEGKTLLHFSSEFGQDDIAEYLINHNTYLDATTAEGATALHLACKSGSLKIVTLLLDRIPQLRNMVTNNKRTALHFAAQNGHDEIVTELLRRKADPNMLALNNLTAFEISARNGHDKIVDIFLGNRNINLSIKQLTEAFCLAALSGQLNVIDTFIKSNLNINTKNSHDLSALHIATMFGHAKIVTTLLQNKADIKDTDCNERTSLHLASTYGHTEIVRKLLKYKCDLNATDILMWTPLHCASHNNNHEVVKILLDKGATNDSYDDEGLTPFHVAAEAGNIDTVKVFLNFDVKIVNCLTKKNKWSALHLAAGRGNTELVRILTQYDKSAINIQAANGSTPLQWAIQRHGYVDIVNFLIDQGADINVQNDLGATALYTAALNGNKEIVEILLKKADNGFFKTKYLPLHIATKFGHIDIVKLLIDETTDVNCPTYHQQTCLHLAAENGHEKIVQFLLEKKANSGIADIFNLTPIHLAAKNGHTDIIQLLLISKADVNVKDNNNKTPLLYAIAGGHEDTALFLIKNGADVNTNIGDNITVLHSAILKGMVKVVLELTKYDIDINAQLHPEKITPLTMALLRDHENIAHILLNKQDVDVNATTKNGSTAMHFVCAKGFSGILKKLLEAEANVNAKTTDGDTPLFLAVKNGHTEIVTSLLSHNADVNVKGKRDITPLHLAILSGHEDIAQTLIEHQNINLNSKTDNSWTAIHFAALKGDLYTLNCFLRKSVSIINDQTDTGNTALHIALKNGHEDIFWKLLEYKANPLLANKEGLTVFDIASEKGLTGVVKQLLQMQDAKGKIKAT